MCALCGVLGVETHWSDAVARPGVFARDERPHNRRLERAKRIKLANVLLNAYAMTLRDWQGTKYLLSTATGKTAVVETLAHLWPTAEVLSGRSFDPLDKTFLDRLSGRR
jgi:hypothetical protein